MTRWSLRLVALAYLTFLLVLPVAIVVWRTFDHGLPAVFHALSTAAAVHAIWLTVVIAFYAVVLNTVFGVIAAVLLVRHDFPGKRALNAVIDLPIAVSPVIVGLALVLVYGANAPVGGWLTDHGLPIIFSLPGMIIATVFVCLPMVVRAVVPVLEEVGDDQEQAASTLGAGRWQTFRRITLPAIRGALAYGVVLALARALGEYGAIAVVSGRLVGRTQTVTLLVQERYQNFDQQGAYSAALVLVLAAVIALLISRALRPKELVR